MLWNSGNIAYQRIVTENMVLAKEVDTVRGLYQGLLSVIESGSLTKKNPSLDDPYSHIQDLPNEPHDTHPEVKYWDHDTWTNSMKRTDDIAGFGGNSNDDPADSDSDAVGVRKPKKVSKKYGFLEDPTGHRVTLQRLDEIRLTTNRVCQYLKARGLGPTSWAHNATLPAAQLVYRVLRAEFIEFQLCDGTWKAERWMIEHYPQWHRHNGMKIVKQEDVDDRPSGPGEGFRNAVPKPARRSVTVKRTLNGNALVLLVY
ncbi:hypothetical protein PUNSTDRAFT_45099 [Punctularia strigosozonata HHB-11173 SS5]|uniref:uncharacterized protein n=1 Tax=Punctularia strigosozonata (strain HHB-11173) TaxID=741275 RepID=UPI0004417E1D|nr:uncharacterized protein PUNSTDRAFT_45099 [Punctularia strigosozonata HHB-11173 SS5]EIN08668.1 hypothetical protein PUNSTDRAFT_45099 [Punctularia strigosozonata HHB-11173 SS5]